MVEYYKIPFTNISSQNKPANKDRIRYAKTKFLLSVKEHQICKFKNYITQEKVHTVTLKKAAMQ